ncbi:hypothetical protein G7046_g1918 [Stylonectria norvegica]|nr:hypothetical protein G7046_g1918 [Stylonectria norvegica]
MGPCVSRLLQLQQLTGLGIRLPLQVLLQASPSSSSTGWIVCAHALLLLDALNGVTRARPGEPSRADLADLGGATWKHEIRDRVVHDRGVTWSRSAANEPWDPGRSLGVLDLRLCCWRVYAATVRTVAEWAARLLMIVDGPRLSGFQRSDSDGETSWPSRCLGDVGVLAQQVQPPTRSYRSQLHAGILFLRTSYASAISID